MRCATANSFLLSGIAIAAVGGCHHESKPADNELTDLQEAWPHRTPPVVEHPRSVMVAEGPSPVVFQVREPSRVHVLDLTTGQEIASAMVARGEMVYVSEDSGAFAGKQRLAAGPFAPGHRYGISIDTDSTESWQTRTEILHQPPPPATQPRQR